MNNNFYFDVDLFVDEYGHEVERNPFSHPYSFDGYVVWSSGTYEEYNTVWSDRLLQWDYDKTRRLMGVHFGSFGDYYDDRTPQKIQSFLSDYFERPIQLHRIMKYCNQSSGYPVWRFDYVDAGQ